MTSAPPNYFATLKASCLASSKRSVAAINDYWAAQGIEARAELAPDGSIVSRINVRKHIPNSLDVASLNAATSGVKQGRLAARSATGAAGIARGTFTRESAR